MPPNTTFTSRSHKPFEAQNSLQLQHDRITGPLSFLNPTRASLKYVHAQTEGTSHSRSPSKDANRDPAVEKEATSHDNEKVASKIEFRWRSRDNRKGRHALVVNPAQDPSGKYLCPQKTTSGKAVVKGIARMATTYPYWDVSWLVAVIFTLGSVVWVINAFFALLPLVKPSTDFENEVLVGGGVSAFIGATIFEIGSALLLIEAFNENRSGCFGWALERVLAGDNASREIYKVRPDNDRCSHHHTNKGNLVGKGNVREPPTTSGGTFSEPTASEEERQIDMEKSMNRGDVNQGFVWWPSMHDLKTHYFKELGFLAALAQLCGATIFWISGLTALPGINDKLSQGLLDGIFWAPQILGGTGFIISGSLYVLETQSKWYIPAWEVLGWHIGFWNLIGAFGFTLCGALGPAYGNSGAEYEASLATFWGSWAFLIGSLIQWYMKSKVTSQVFIELSADLVTISESLDKHPVEINRQDVA